MTEIFVRSVRESMNNCAAGRMSTISQSIFQYMFQMNVFTMRREDSSRCLPVQVGLVTTNNGSYPHEDNMTVAGSGGSCSGVLRMRKGKDVDLTWEKGG